MSNSPNENNSSDMQPASKAGLFRRKTYTTPREKLIDLTFGFVGWFVVNSLLWIIVKTPGRLGLGFLLIPFLVNIGGLILMTIIRRWMALGALFAFGLNLVIEIALGMFVSGMCMIITWPDQSTFPFFLKFLLPILSTMFGIQLIFSNIEDGSWSRNIEYP